ncbi:hypothetical protein QA601_03310 [Chitinispirillales bacterium ANBcel5]|uniref:hypothetical protein n=1 Tax=Cellulosispirillum alkaliphilum TaxID=3039283 RepID=UPI002A54E9EA|nr:hypothetical protein [Chitinispirillales bacterium ANBcel5]
MEKLRIPFLIVAGVLLSLAFLLQIGSGFLAQFLASFFDSQMLIDAGEAGVPPGLAIRYMALFDGLFLYTVVLILLPLITTHGIHAKYQGVVTLILSVIAIVLAIVLAIVAVLQLIIMVSLLFAPIFGTIAYFSLYASFPINTSRGILSMIMALKIGFAFFLLFAHQRFLQNRSLVILTLVSMALGIVISFLHGIVPGFLVSITDAIAAILVVIVAFIWAVKYLIGGVMSVKNVFT